MTKDKVASNENEREEVIDTLTPYLSQYSLGAKIRRLRLRKSMGLVELGKHTGLSAAMLSKLENNHVVPTLQTLSKIALVFSVGLDHFFANPADHHTVAVTRAGDRMDFDEKIDDKDILYSFQCLDYTATERKSTAYLATFTEKRDGKSLQHTHDGHEFIYVLSGTLGLEVENENVNLKEADTAYFDARLPHGYHKVGDTECKAIVVTIP